MKYLLLQTLEMAKVIEVASGTCRIEGLHAKLALDGVIEQFLRHERSSEYKTEST